MNFLRNCITHVRCWLTHTIIKKTSFSKRYAVANLIAPSTDDVIRAAKEVRLTVPHPKYTHIIYHQETVDQKAADNSLQSLLSQFDSDDEVIFLDVGNTFPADRFLSLADFEWVTYMSCKAQTPEQKSYTFGINSVMPSVKGDSFIVWRTDYVFPKGFYQAYKESLSRHQVVIPYYVYVGKDHVDSQFVSDHWEKLDRYDESFWSEHSKQVSLYETQDPALLCMKTETWKKLGGLNHALWGYGWQYADLNGRMRNLLPDSDIHYLDFAPAVHQHHEGSLQLIREKTNEKMDQEWGEGEERFKEYLGSEAAYFCYRYRWILSPLKEFEKK